MNRTVWTNHELQPSAERYLREELERRGDRLVQSAASSRSVLLPGEPDPSLAEVDIAYVTSRGRWYHQSWKGDESKSGGIATNIGVHFFDMLAWIFGRPLESNVHLRRADCAAGLLRLERATVRWFLSINEQHLPEDQRTKGKRTYRSITVGGESLEFSEGFTDLHTESYRDILSGGGFPISESRIAIQMVHQIRGASLTPADEGSHAFCRKVTG